MSVKIMMVKNNT